jgi:peptide/nickel transport system permease protein
LNGHEAPGGDQAIAQAASPGFWRHAAGVPGGLFVGAAIVAFWVVCALSGAHFVPHDPYASDPLAALLPPSADHWFGTDQLGRDILARVLVGARDIFRIAPLATLLGVSVGAALGLLTGYAGGWIDFIGSRLIDAMLALPLNIIALLALAATGASDMTIVLAIGAAFAPVTARTVRASARAERHLDYVDAARLRGESAMHIMLREILPNIAAPVVIEATVRLGYAVFTVATLSFLGFGVQPPSPDWGLAVAENYALLAGGAWWTVVFDALATASLIVGIHLVAEGIGERFDA